MATGAILFFIGLAVLVGQGFKKNATIRFLEKEYRLGRFVTAATVAGITFIMVAVYIQKLFPTETAQTKIAQPTISSNLKYELEAILPSDESNTKITKAINRFQKEYHNALENDDKNTSELLVLEMAFLIRAELEKQNYPSHQIGSEVERIMIFLKQKSD